MKNLQNIQILCLNWKYLLSGSGPGKGWISMSLTKVPRVIMQKLYSWFCRVKNCRHTNMVNLGQPSTQHGQNCPDFKSGSVIQIWSVTWICNRDNLGHNRLKMEQRQDLPYFYADNSSRNQIKRINSAFCLWFPRVGCSLLNRLVTYKKTKLKKNWRKNFLFEAFRVFISFFNRYSMHRWTMWL